MTNARWFTPDRRPLDREGLTPDIVVEPAAQQTENDLMLARAVAFLNERP